MANDEIRRPVRDLIGCLSHLDGVLCKTRRLGYGEPTALTTKLAAMKQTVDELIDLVERTLPVRQYGRRRVQDRPARTAPAPLPTPGDDDAGDGHGEAWEGD